MSFICYDFTCQDYCRKKVENFSAKLNGHKQECFLFWHTESLYCKDWVSSYRKLFAPVKGADPVGYHAVWRWWLTYPKGNYVLGVQTAFWRMWIFTFALELLAFVRKYPSKWCNVTINIPRFGWKDIHLESLTMTWHHSSYYWNMSWIY